MPVVGARSLGRQGCFPLDGRRRNARIGALGLDVSGAAPGRSGCASGAQSAAPLARQALTFSPPSSTLSASACAPTRPCRPAQAPHSMRSAAATGPAGILRGRPGRNPAPPLPPTHTPLFPLRAASGARPVLRPARREAGARQHAEQPSWPRHRPWPAAGPLFIQKVAPLPGWCPRRGWRGRAGGRKRGTAFRATGGRAGPLIDKYEPAWPRP